MTQQVKPTIALVTGNKGKLEEMERYLGAYVNVLPVSIDLPELQGATTEEISFMKAVEAFRVVRQMKEGEALRSGSTLAVLVDDTSLGFDAMGDLPGPYIKWFLASLKNEGLICMTEGFATPGDTELLHRRARASCVITYCCGPSDSVGEPVVKQFVGVCPGRIVDEPRGKNNFGWDPIFAPAEQEVPYAKTFAEMTIEEKNVISHRAKALAMLKEYLASVA